MFEIVINLKAAPLKERRLRWPREARMLQEVPHRVPKRPDTSSNPADIRGHTASARNHGACPPHAAAAEWIIGIQHNSGATEAWVWAIDNVMLLLHPGVV